MCPDAANTREVDAEGKPWIVRNVLAYEADKEAAIELVRKRVPLSACAPLRPASGFPPASPVSVRRSRSAIAPEWPASAASDSHQVDQPSSGRCLRATLLPLTCRNASFRFARSHTSSMISDLSLAGSSGSLTTGGDSMSSRPACRASLAVARPIRFFIAQEARLDGSSWFSQHP